jgi:pyrroline-5-carboxylate reductase
MIDLFQKQLIVIGVGNIGRILLERLRAAGVPLDHLAVCETDLTRETSAAGEFGVRTLSLTDEAACTADIFLMATPPPVVPQILETIADRLRPGQVVVSFAAAMPLARLEVIVPEGVAVARVMPNAPSLVGQGMNPVAFGASVTPEARALIEAVLTTLGDTIEVRDEQMNWCVGLTGAAMRSVLPVLEGMTQAGVKAGLSVAEARRVAAQVMAGTAAVALQTGLSFEEIKALTPMQTIDEMQVAELFVEAARNARGKIDQLQQKLAVS